MKTTKSKKANLERKRFMFFQIGLALTLGFVLAAFEWTTVDSFDKDLLLIRGDVTEEEMAEITVQKMEKKEMPRPQVVMPIEIVTNSTEIEEEIEFNAEVTEETENNLDFLIEEEKEEEPEDPQIYISVQEYPSFPGGDHAFYEYISKNLIYPSTAREIGLSGRVYVKFVIWKDGSVRNVEILRGIGGACDETARNVIKNMPPWIPGKQSTKPVNVQMVLPVIFRLN